MLVSTRRIPVKNIFNNILILVRSVRKTKDQVSVYSEYKAGCECYINEAENILKILFHTNI